MGHPGAQHPRTVHYLALARPSFQVLHGLFIKKASTLRQKLFFGGPSRGPTPTDCSLPRSRSAVLSSPAWPFYKKSFHLTAEAFLWWAIQGPNTHGLMNSPLDCSLPRSRSAIQDSSPGPSGYENVANFEISFFLWNLVTIS